MTFSLALDEDQRDLRDWVHGFAADVVRPAAAEWDEREDTPRPVVQEAARIGLYGFESLAELFADPPESRRVHRPARHPGRDGQPQDQEAGAARLTHRGRVLR